MEAIANWLWQGSVIAIASTALLHVSRGLGATARYRLWWTAMAIVLVLPFATTPDLPVASTPRAVSEAASSSSSFVGSTLQVRVAPPPSWAANALLAMWAIWVAIGVSRITAATVGLHRARRAARPFPPSRETRLENWMALSHRGRRARLVLSDDVRYAAVLGGRTPVIAIAPAVADSLADRDLDRIVVHEWAHVQRRDDFHRLVQLAVRAIAGLHPAVWWLDRRIHTDRETACDDWTVNLTGSAKAYALSLTRLAMIDARPRHDILAPAAIVPSELTRRVMSLLDDSRTTSTQRWNLWTAAIVPALLALAFAVSDVQLIAIEREVVAAVRSSLGIATSTVDGVIAVDRPMQAPVMPPTAPETPRRPSSQRPAPVPETPQAAASAPVLEASSDVPNEPRSEAESTNASQVFSVPSPSVLPGLPSAGSTQSGVVPLPLSADGAVKTPWGATADAGVQVGRGSQKAAVATAGFFSRLGKSIARSF